MRILIDECLPKKLKLGLWEHQQNLKQFDLALVVLVAPTNDINDLIPVMPVVKDLLNDIQPGEIESVQLD